MSGIEKINEQILADARKEADEIVGAARKEADSEASKAAERSSQQRRKAEESLERELKDYRQRAESARDLSRRRMILERKQEIISGLIEKTLDQLVHAEDKTYFSMLETMLSRYAHEGEGKLYLNSRDLKRMPSDFKDKAQAQAKKNGGSIEIMDTPGEIEDGFLLVYGGTQENCTFEALVAAERNQLQDEVNAMLWRDGDVG